MRADRECDKVRTLARSHWSSQAMLSFKSGVTSSGGSVP